MNGVRASEVILDERQLTKRIEEEDVKQTLLDFEGKRRSPTGDEVELIMRTTEETEARASILLDLGEAALTRLFGALKFNISVITSQPENRAQIRISQRAVQRVASACGISSSANQRTGISIENFVANRVSAEYQLLRLSFNNTDLLSSPNRQITLYPSGRTLNVSRSQQFR